LDSPVGYRHLSVHDVYTFCSHLAMRGAPARAIQGVAGRQDLMTTHRYSRGRARAGLAADLFHRAKDYFLRRHGTGILGHPYLCVEPKEGMALVFVHTIWHEGAVVQTGRKYVLRGVSPS
jgi:hypothetical protein